MAVIADYPDGDSSGTPGPFISNLDTQPQETLVDIFPNEDGGADINVQPCGVRRWVLTYEAMSFADAEIIRAHLNAAKGKVNEFDFYSRQENLTFSNCFYISIETPEHQKHWSNGLRITLGKFA